MAFGEGSDLLRCSVSVIDIDREPLVPDECVFSSVLILRFARVLLRIRKKLHNFMAGAGNIEPMRCLQRQHWISAAILSISVECSVSAESKPKSSMSVGI
jgi:hypothetical protein